MTTPAAAASNLRAPLATRRYTLLSTTDEYVALSWFAARQGAAPQVQMLTCNGPGRAAVFGLHPSASGAVTFRARAAGAPVSIQAYARAVDQVVGTSGEPQQLAELVFDLTPGDAPMQAVIDVARSAFRRAFDETGVRVYFPRKVQDKVEWKEFGTLPPRPLASVRLANEAEAEILADAKRFLSSEADYAKHGRPFKRVYCLHGPPGAGKTSAVHAIASELGRPLAMFSVDGLRDDSFLELLACRPTNSILLFEDAHSMSDDNGGAITLSTVLNVLDGVLHPHGALVFLTTNEPERLAESMSRPGRIDRAVSVSSTPTQDQALAIWRAFFNEAPPPPPAALKQLSPARLSEILFAMRNEGHEAASRAVRAATTTGSAPVGPQTPGQPKSSHKKKA